MPIDPSALLNLWSLEELPACNEGMEHARAFLTSAGEANITLTEPGPFAFAGIWDAWKRPDGSYLETFALVTTEPNELVAQIHDRLALILHPRDYDRWLGIDDKGGDPRPPLDLLHPYDADKMVMKPANPAVGNWRNNGPEMLDRT